MGYDKFMVRKSVCCSRNDVQSVDLQYTRMPSTMERSWVPVKIRPGSDPAILLHIIFEVVPSILSWIDCVPSQPKAVASEVETTEKNGVCPDEVMGAAVWTTATVGEAEVGSNVSSPLVGAPVGWPVVSVGLCVGGEGGGGT